MRLGLHGVKGCRRCTVSGTYISERRHYYYGNFHARYWNPCSKRSASRERANGRKADAASTVAERKRISKDTGVTGESIFFRLYDLCGFDPVQDLVIDAMHAITLNLIRMELLNHLLADLGDNASVPPLDRDPKNGGLLDRSKLALALGKVDWTTEFRDGRVPSISLDKNQGLSKLPYWKAEEYSKFIIVAPVVLRGLIPLKAYKCFMLLRTIHNLVFSRRLRIQGWTIDHISYFKKVLWSHAILYEACCENVEYSLHMPEDIERHSLLDNYWCYLYERLVKYYKQQSSNMKTLCKTFSDRAAQLQFVNTYLSTHTSSTDHSKSQSLKTADVRLLTASSINDAIQLKNSLINETNDQTKRCLESGIFLGKSCFRSLSDQELADIQYWLRNESIQEELPNACRTYSRFLGTTDYDFSVVYRVGENVIATDAIYPGREWLVTITHIMVYGPVNNQFHFFFKGTFFSAIPQQSGCLSDTQWTDQPLMVRRDYQRLCVYPLKSIDRKVMVYPSGSRDSFLTIDTDPLVDCSLEAVSIPYYPKPREIIQIASRSERHQDYLLVESVLTDRLDSISLEYTEGHVRGYKLRKVRGTPSRWKALQDHTSITFDKVASEAIPHRLNAGFIYLDF